jgi:hypothetical protein
MKKQLSRTSVIKSLLFAIILTALFLPSRSLAQSSGWPSDSTQIKAYIDAKMKKPSYPRAVGYLSFILPLVTVSNSTTFNFNSTTTAIGFPVGVNVLYSDHFGFSYEFTPTIKTTNGGATKVTDILFDPGTMFRFQHGFTLITRLAFDTNGRYGFTPVFNQVYLRTKDVNYFVALSLPARFGTGEDASVGLNLQIGFIFN